MRSRDWSRVLAGLALTAPIAQVAHAEIYLTDGQAAKVLFPGLKMEADWVDLTPAETSAIQTSSGERVLFPRVRIFRGPNGEAVLIDQVVGKHDFITYAVGIAPDGKVEGVEIMDYKETFGYQVRQPGWRKQFAGKTSKDPIRVDKDIQNISGATLSCAHVASGVRRVLSTYEVIKKR